MSQDMEKLHQSRAAGYTLDNGEVTAGELPAGVLERLNTAAKQSAVAVTVAGAMAVGAPQAEANSTVPVVDGQNANVTQTVNHFPQTDDYSTLVPQSAAPSMSAGSNSDDPNCVGSGLGDTLKSINPFDGGLTMRKLVTAGLAYSTGGASLAVGAVTNVGDDCLFSEPAETRMGQFAQTVGKGALRAAAVSVAGDVGSSFGVDAGVAVLDKTTGVMDKPMIGGGHDPAPREATASIHAGVFDEMKAFKGDGPSWQATAKPAEPEPSERLVFLDDRGYEIAGTKDGMQYGTAHIEREMNGQTSWQSLAVKPGDQANAENEQQQRSPSLGG